MKTAILILAAGASSRMGRVKQLLPYQHTHLLGWTIEQALNTSTKVFCVLGANATAIEKEIPTEKITLLYNPDFNNGLSTSIVTGVTYLYTKEFHNVLILLADQPHISSAYLNQMIQTGEENPQHIIASNYGHKAGVPALFPKKYYRNLLTLTGDKGAKLFLEQHASNIITMPEINLIDIDTPQDYDTAIGIIYNR